jgi:cytochrome c oxidase assembly protein subunit 15
LLQHVLAIIHACFAQAFFALTVSLVLFTAKEWREPIAKKAANDAVRVQHLGIITIGLLYMQLILGALLRHTGEWAHLHIAGALVVAVHVILLVIRVVRNHADLPLLRRSAALLLSLLVVQVGLGIAAYFAKFTVSGFFLNPWIVPLATLHVVVGALMLVSCVVLTLRAYRLLVAPQTVFHSPLVSKQASV